MVNTNGTILLDVNVQLELQTGTERKTKNKKKTNLIYSGIGTKPQKL